MKNDDDFIHLPELYLKLGTLKNYLHTIYKLNISPMTNSHKNSGYDDGKMAMINCDIIHEYAVKLDKMIDEDTQLEEWVKMKLSKAELMMASVKHALIGIEKYDHGGELFKKQLLHIAKYANAIIEELERGTELMSWMESNLAVCADYMDGIYHHLDYKLMGNRAEDLETSKMAKGGGVGMMNTAKSYWNMFDKEKRVDFLIGAGYSKSVAEDLSNEDWDSLEVGVHKNLLSSMMADGGGVGKTISEIMSDIKWEYGYRNIGDIYEIYFNQDGQSNIGIEILTNDYSTAKDIERDFNGYFDSEDDNDNWDYNYAYKVTITKQFKNGGGVGSDKTIVDFIITLEKSKIMAPGSHKNQKAIDVVKSIISMNEKEYSEYIKENPNKNVTLIYTEYQDWKQTYADGGGVGYFKSGYTLRGRKGKYWIDDVEGRVTKDRYFEKEEDAIAEIDLLSRFKKLRNEQRKPGPSIENLIEADRYYVNGGGVGKYYVIDAKKGEIVSKGFDTEEEAKVEMYKMFEETGNIFLTQKMMADGGSVKAAQGMFLDGEFEEIVSKVKDYISKYPYVWTRGNKSYVPVEGWQYAASLMGLSARVVETYPVTEKNGWMSKAEVVNQNGVVVCSGFGFVGRDEEKWAKSIESDLESFAQTKAVSRALRNCISYLIKAAGYSTTPAEEMYGLKGESKSSSRNFSSKKPSLRPIYGVPDEDFIFDRPEYRPEMPTQKPIEKASTEERSAISILLQKVWAEAKGRGIVIVSQEFMDKIENALLNLDTSNLSFELLLTEAYSWMIDNKVVLRSKIFMKEIANAVNGFKNM